MNYQLLREIAAVVEFAHRRLRNFQCDAETEQVLTKHNLALLNIVMNLETVSHCILADVSPLGKEYCSISISSADFSPERTTT